ncbi:uncharacterized protein B0I36DRAFT_432402 [Microdochium trichocladiopsis]|uniref:Thiamine pyrophosphate enzyme TPP-binding domain-containing protein n=1 Tax=Microdochium trichocladiopsis TaxID=1682393 RepID=A0A9P8Y4U3_9PEZI|nr:uncharacterized protein B0I36DRAFT_432402 [Microdochium trichocladiopsis]KAH7029748.1 hypothetical protein B0I36DRAFT_432402 [Microdochium trichocladiopsis]
MASCTPMGAPIGLPAPRQPQLYVKLHMWLPVMRLHIWPSPDVDAAPHIRACEHAFGDLSKYRFSLSASSFNCQCDTSSNDGTRCLGYNVITSGSASLTNSGLSNALSPRAVAGLERRGGHPDPAHGRLAWQAGHQGRAKHALIGPQPLDNLAANKLAYELMPETPGAAREVVARLVAKAVADKTPVALVVNPGTFNPFKAAGGAAQGPEPLLVTVGANAGVKMWLTKGLGPTQSLTREAVVRRVMQQLDNSDRSDVVVTSLGGTSREAYMVLHENGTEPGPGRCRRAASSSSSVPWAMGHAFAVTCGVHLGLSGLGQQQREPLPRPYSTVYCVDGDGSFLMHAGNNAVLADVGPKGLVHVVVHNGVHSSTGDQPLSLTLQAYIGLAGGMLYTHKFFVDDPQALDPAMNAAVDMTADSAVSVLIMVLVKPGQSPQLPRPSETAGELKNVFMQSIE